MHQEGLNMAWGSYCPQSPHGHVYLEDGPFRCISCGFVVPDHLLSKVRVTQGFLPLKFEKKIPARRLDASAAWIGGLRV
jgi:hypothetical protein